MPDDWSLKTEIEIQMPLLKSIDSVEDILNYKDVAHQLSYFIYMETQLPKFLQENQSKPKLHLSELTLSVYLDAEYLRNADKINWVKSFKDVYQKFVASYQRAQTSTDQNLEMLDELDMPCFYLRN